MPSEQFKQELQRRRAELTEHLGDDVLVLLAAPVYPRNGDVEHLYRQDSDFYYLTGLEEPEAALVLRRGEPDFVLFVRPRDREREIWDGRRTGVEGAVLDFGADEAFPISQLKDKLPDLLEGRRRVHYHFGQVEDWDSLIFGAVATLRGRRRKRVDPPTELVAASELLHCQRRIKSEFELQRMREAALLTATAHRRAMQVAQGGMTEHELESELQFVLRRGGGRREAYESIVGSGANGTILHYRENDRTMEAEDLVLIDAGVELDYYAADITRTFPVGGRFSPAQRQLYEITLAAHQAGLAQCAPGRTLDDIHDAAFKVIREGLVELGLIAEDCSDKDKETRRFFMHRTSHYLGMDVHDVGAYFKAGELLPLEAGVAITVEPGIYVSESDDTVAAEYRGIGIRIEDDIVVTQAGYENLTASVPTDPDEIEALCRS